MLKGSSARPTALRACAPILHPNRLRMRSVNPLMTAGWRLNPGAELTIQTLCVDSEFALHEAPARMKFGRNLDSLVRWAIHEAVGLVKTMSRLHERRSVKVRPPVPKHPCIAKQAFQY